MASSQLEAVARGMAMARERFLYGLEKTPDDRLTWSPGGSAKTPLQLAGSVSGFMGFMEHVLRTGEMPERRGELPPAPDSRQAAQDAVRSGIDRLLATIQGLGEGDLQRPVPVPWGVTVPAVEFASFVPAILAYFQGQLNYLQTAYGDMDPNIPPSWRGGEEYR